MLVSFIIPSYNSAQTVTRCLDSIYALSLKPQEFEIIFIDDCSTDDTCDIVAAYQSNHPNITLLRQPENHRQGAARNRGVKIAKGEYICFVDSDDAVTEGVVNAILLAKEKEVDMVVFHYANASENGEITSEAEQLSFSDGQVFTGIEMQNAHPYWCSGPVAYMYRREFLESVNYPFVEGVLYEDSDFVANHLYRAKRMTYSSELGYKAYYREGSTTRSMTYRNLADYLLLGTRMLSLYERIVKESFEQERDKTSKDLETFAEDTLEGACHNIERAFHRLPRLKSWHDRWAFYHRIKEKADWREFKKNKLIRRYYWNSWTCTGIYAPWFMLMLCAIVSPIQKIIK